MAAAPKASLDGSEVVPAPRSDHGDDIRVGDAVLVIRRVTRPSLPRHDLASLNLHRAKRDHPAADGLPAPGGLEPFTNTRDKARIQRP